MGCCGGSVLWGFPQCVGTVMLWWVRGVTLVAEFH